MKDVPMVLPPCFAIAAITERADPRDAFVSNSLPISKHCPTAAASARRALRRESQIRAHFPRLVVEPLARQRADAIEKTRRWPCLPRSCSPDGRA